MPIGFIKCDFEADFCGWALEADQSNFSLQRLTGSSVVEMNIEGPTLDVNGDVSKHFLMTTNYLSQDLLPGVTSSITSPTFLASEHPFECMKFWFSFGVNDLLKVNTDLYIAHFFQRNGDGNWLSIYKVDEADTAIMVWSLYDSYILDQQDGWHQGQVVIEAPTEHNYRV